MDQQHRGKPARRSDQAFHFLVVGRKQNNRIGPRPLAKDGSRLYLTNAHAHQIDFLTILPALAQRLKGLRGA